MDRLISEQEVFKIIDSLKANFTCYDFVTLDEVVSHVKALPSADEDEWVKRSDVLKVIDKRVDERLSEPKWIPVSERLPQKSEYGDVLVTYIPSAGTLWTTVMIAQYSDLMGIAKPSFHIGEVGKKSFRNITAQVTAWMPLPKAYRNKKPMD